MRVAQENSRMSDLVAMLAIACQTDPARRNGLATRIEDRRRVITALLDQSDGWSDWHRRRFAADGLVEEMVGMLVTRLLRENGVGGQVFESAEGLLDELAAAAGVPGVALGQTQGSESMDHGLGSVAMRFPGSRIWELPFLAHEFGHHAVPHLRDLARAGSDKRPLALVVSAVAEILAEDRLDRPRAESHAEELVADAVATVSFGATYPIACLCLRTPEAAEATRSTRTHPSWCARVTTMRATLDRLSELTGLARYRRLRENVVDRLVVDALGAIPTPVEAALEAGERTVDVVHDRRSGLIYRGADRAMAVEQALRALDHDPPPDTDVRSVVDGAWRWRLAAGPDSDEAAVEDLATRYCLATSAGARS
jgi:hypothetical protein